MKISITPAKSTYYKSEGYKKPSINEQEVSAIAQNALCQKKSITKLDNKPIRATDDTALKGGSNRGFDPVGCANSCCTIL